MLTYFNHCIYLVNWSLHECAMTFKSFLTNFGLKSVLLHTGRYSSLLYPLLAWHIVSHPLAFKLLCLYVSQTKISWIVIQSARLRFLIEKLRPLIVKITLGTLFDSCNVCWFPGWCEYCFFFSFSYIPLRSLWFTGLTHLIFSVLLFIRFSRNICSFSWIYVFSSYLLFPTYSFFL